MDIIQIGKRITKIRKSVAIDQNDLGKLMGVSRTTVSNWERGHKKPNTEKLISLAELGNVSLDWLIIGKEAGAQENGKIVSTIEPGNDVAKQKIKKQNNRPTVKNILLSLMVQWMDESFEKNEKQGLWFYDDIRDNYPSFRDFLEKKQLHEDHPNRKLDNLSEETGS